MTNPASPQPLFQPLSLEDTEAQRTERKGQRQGSAREGTGALFHTREPSFTHGHTQLEHREALNPSSTHGLLTITLKAGTGTEN